MSLLRTVWEYLDLIFVILIVGYIIYSGLGGVLYHLVTGTLQKTEQVELKLPERESEKRIETPLVRQVPPQQETPQQKKELPQKEIPKPAEQPKKEQPIQQPPIQPPQQIPPVQPPVKLPAVQPPSPEPQEPSEEVPAIEQPPKTETPPVEQPKIEPITEQPTEAQPTKSQIDIARLEKRVFELINYERKRNGRKELKWNDEVANVARLHSQYLARFNKGLTNSFYLNHADANGEYQDSRLNKARVYYFDMSAENLHANSIVKRYWVDEHNTPAEYNTEEELAQKADTGWMNSPGHRQNIMTAEYDESGIGIAVDETGTNYIYTQVFIRRVECGFETGKCCEKTGYLPYCYIPLQCREGICS